MASRYSTSIFLILITSCIFLYGEQNLSSKADQLKQKAWEAHISGDLEAASSHLEEAIDATRAPSEGGHPDTVELLLDLALVKAEQGKTAEAKSLIDRAHELGHGRLMDSLVGLSEREALNLVPTHKRVLNMAASLALAEPQNRKLALWAWEIVARSRGMVSEVLTRRRQLAGAIQRRELKSELGRDLARLRGIVSRLNELRERSTAAFARYRKGNRKNDELVRLEIEKNKAERKLAKVLNLYHGELEPPDLNLEEVLAQFTNTAIIAFLRLNRIDFDVSERESHRHHNETPIYAAFQFQPSGQIHVKSLSHAQEIDSLVTKWRLAISQGVFTQEEGLEFGHQDYFQIASLLRTNVWDPLVNNVDRADRICIIPDGPLHFLSFESLPLDHNRFLVEEQPHFVYLSTERELRAPKPLLRSKQGMLVVADPASKSFLSSGEDGNASQALESLPGSVQEATEVVELWNSHLPKENAIVLTGEEANKARFEREAPNSRILHLATHSHFSDPEVPIKPTGASTGESGSNIRFSSRAGLVFADDPQSQVPAGNHAILWAHEIATLDLRGVELVVLSACESGLGEIIEVEGVLGLKRAFRMAGARQFLLSLWSLDDQAAREWMVRFYKHYFQQDESSARSAQMATREILSLRRAEGRSTHPFFWASFVTVGLFDPWPLAHFSIDSVNVVVTDVVVTDRQNKIVHSLTAEDFEISENGIAQKIEHFIPATTRLYRRVPNPIAILFDFPTISSEARKKLVAALRNQVTDSFTDRDFVGLFVLDRSLEMVLDLTNDSLEVLNALESVENRPHIPISESKKIQSYRSAPHVAHQSWELEDFRRFLSAANAPVNGSQSLLGSIEKITHYLKGIPGRKTLIVLSSGIEMGTESEVRFSRSIHLANASGVSVYGVSVAGLSAPRLDREIRPSSALEDLTPASDRSTIDALMRRDSRRQDALQGESIFDRAKALARGSGTDVFEELCTQTGGFLIRDTNDFAQGLRQIEGDIRSHYLLTYSPTDQALDGTYRSIRVDLKKEGYKVRHRSGYLAAPDDLLILSENELRILNQVEKGEIDLTLSADIQIDTFRGDGGQANAVVTVEVSKDSIHIDRENDEYRAMLNVIGLVKDQKGQVLFRIGSPMDLRLTEEQFQQARSQGVSIDGQMALDAGEYLLDFLVIDLLGRRVARLNRPLRVEDLSDELAMSSIVLARSVTPVGSVDGLLYVDGVKFAPSATCSFRNGDQLPFFFRVYNFQNQGNGPDLAVRISIQKSGIETPLWISEDTPFILENTDTASVSGFLGLKGLPPGTYFLTANITDRISLQTAYKRALFKIVE